MSDEQGLWRVVETIPENEDVTSVVIEAPGGAAPAPTPGQYAALKIPEGEGWSKPHAFTISDAPALGRYKFTIKRVGEFSSGVRSWKPGDVIQCTGPMGAFCRDVGVRNRIVMIAGGVGITPFLSVLRSFAKSGTDNHITLYWANKTFADAFAARELEAITDRLDLRIVHVLSREAPPAAHHPKVSFERGHFSAELVAKHCCPAKGL